jgi:hypothetical protein
MSPTFDPPPPPGSTWVVQDTWADQQLRLLNAEFGDRWDIWYQPIYAGGHHWNARPKGARLATINMTTPEALAAEIRRQEARSRRPRDLSDIPESELKRLCRELAVAAGLAAPGTNGRHIILAELQAVKTALASRREC